MFKVIYVSASLLLSLSFSLSASAQNAPISNTEIVTTCLEAVQSNTNGCAAIIESFAKQLQADGLTPEQVDQLLISVSAELAEATLAIDLSPAAAARIGAGLRVAAAAVSDSEMQMAIIEVAAAEEAGEDFTTADIETLASAN